MRARDPRCFCIDHTKCLLCQRDFGRIAENLQPYYKPIALEHKRGNGRVEPAKSRFEDDGPVQRERSLESTSRVSPRGLS